MLLPSPILKPPDTSNERNLRHLEITNPDIHPRMTPNTLNTARRYAEKHTLTTREMEDIQKEVKRQTNPPTNPPANLDPKPNGESSLEINSPTAKNNTPLNQGLEPPPREEGIDSIMMDLLITTAFLSTQQNINITDLNTLHYTAAVTLARTKQKQPLTTKNNQDPNEADQKKINKIRRWIRKLTAIKNRNKFTNKIKNLSRTTLLNLPYKHRRYN